MLLEVIQGRIYVCMHACLLTAWSRKYPLEERIAGDAVFFGGDCDCAGNPSGIHHVGLMM